MKTSGIFPGIVVAVITAGSLFAGPEPIATDSKVMQQPVVEQPMCRWTGFYLGGHAGYAWSGDASFLELEESDPPFEFNDVDGFVGGGQVGFNLQLGSWFVIGVEGTFASFDIDDHAKISDGSEETRGTYDRDWLATVGGRVGVTFCKNRILAYAKGGVGFSNWDFNTHEVGADERFHVGDDDETFPVFGIGVEYAFNCHWSVRVEYNHLFAGENEDVVGIETEGDRREKRTWHSNRDDFDLVQGGINFKF